MNKTYLRAALLGSMLLSSLPAIADESYLAVGAGRSEYRLDGASDNKTAISLTFGQKLGDNWGYEVGYLNFGSVEGEVDIGSVSVDSKLRAQSVYLAAVGTLPLGEAFSVFAKAGLSANYVKASGTVTTNGSSYSGSRSETKVGPMLGLGLAYDFTKDIAGEIEYRYFDEIADGGLKASALTAGIRYKF